MSDFLEQLIEEERAEERAETREEYLKEITIRMLNINLPLNIISQVTDFSIEEIKEIQQNMSTEA
jgi:uncharacterized protein YnzC (UPF0291/DUF896 family)